MLQVVIAEPYSNFKQKIKITKAYLKQKAKVSIYKDYVYAELTEGGI